MGGGSGGGSGATGMGGGGTDPWYQNVDWMGAGQSMGQGMSQGTGMQPGGVTPALQPIQSQAQPLSGIPQALLQLILSGGGMGGGQGG